MISIIIPVYNSEKYLETCIKSILNQTFTDFELILVNDGSNDNSKKICDKYSALDKRIKTFHTKNKGVSAARNLGLDYASGEYIAFYDSDDFLKEKDSLEKLYNHAKNNDVDILKSDYVTYDNTGYWSYPKQQKISLSNIKLTPIEFIRDIINKESFLWTLLIRRTIIGDTRFIEGRVYLEDMEFIYKLTRNVTSAVYIPQRHYVYRKHSEAISYTANPLKIRDIIEVMSSFFQIAETCDLKIYYLNKGAQLYVSLLRMIAVGGFFSRRKEIINDMEIEKYKQETFKILKFNGLNISYYYCMSPNSAIILIHFLKKMETYFYLMSYKIKRFLCIYK